jgi:zinc/manganese transport system substrate-binding protein
MVALAPLVALWASTSTLAQSPVTRSLRVVTSFSILADLTREVGGSAVDVATLVKPDADAHVFEPSPTDARRLADAELVIVNGLGFEGWIDRLVRASGYRGPIIVASQGILPRRRGDEPDPHAWQDLANAQRYALNIRDALVKARPGLADAVSRNSAQYIERLQVLDREVRARFDAIPRRQRRVITSHDAFEYFGAAYGVDFMAPQGVSTDSEASAAAVARLIEQIRREGVQAVFVENITDARLVQRIAREGGATLGGRLYSDALSKPGTEADTYLKLFAHNAKTIVAGMAGTR